jgi:hypothetical protein
MAWACLRSSRWIVSPEDLARFTQLALAELNGLHEGKMARLRIRPSEFGRWASRYQSSNARGNARLVEIEFGHSTML